MLFRYLIAVFALAANVSASLAAGPFEALLLYYAYTMEREAFSSDKSNLFLGWKCAQDNGGKTCDFNKFISYAYKDGLGDYKISGGKGPFNPDNLSKYPKGPGDRATFIQMAQDLYNAGFTRTHFNKPQVFKGAVASDYYSYMIEGVIDRVQHARGAGKTAALPAVDNALWAIKGERVADNLVDESFNDLMAKVKARIGMDPIARNPKPVSPGGREYSDLDYDATADMIRKSTTLTPKEKADKLTAMTRGVTDWQRSGFHYRLILEMGKQLNRVRGACTL